MSTLSRGYRKKGGKRPMSMKKRGGKSAMSMRKRGGKSAMSMRKRGGGNVYSDGSSPDAWFFLDPALPKNLSRLHIGKDQFHLPD